MSKPAYKKEEEPSISSQSYPDADQDVKDPSRGVYEHSGAKVVAPFMSPMPNTAEVVVKKSSRCEIL